MATSLDWLFKNRIETSPDHSDYSLRTRFFPFEQVEMADAVDLAIDAIPNWRITSRDTTSIKAERSTGVFGFVDDITITTVAHKAGSSIDVVSASRVGKGDLGQNKRNVIELFGAIGVELMDEKPPQGFEGILFCHWTPYPFDKVAPLFFDPDFLPVISPPSPKITISDKPDPVTVGSKMKINIGGIVAWEVEFIEWDPPNAFADRQSNGPFKEFIHRHTFTERAGGCIICDRVHYQYKQGLFGGVSSMALSGAQLVYLFAQRAENLDYYLEENMTP